ncbi:MAG: electron transport complex subunit RsxC [Halothiobacillaceae bacterium]|nr:electron transport complex subunit RsxC [Halothiobacillaceae bacterium]
MLNRDWLTRLRLRWGVHPLGRKEQGNREGILTLPLPSRLHVPMLQHTGQPAKPRVTVGQRVRKGEMIAARQGNISAPVHAPTSGTVIAIGDYPAPHPSGLPVLTVSIDCDGLEEWVDLDPPSDPFALAPEALAAKVAEAGIVGLGGATFPSAVKMALGLRTQVRTLLVNGSECEPYLSCDDRLMRERAAAIVDGMNLIRHAVGAETILCGIEDNKPEALAAMREAAAPFPHIALRRLPTRYPMGSDRQLIQVLTGREVPSDGRSADVGVLVHNVATCYAVHEALRYGRPLISRIVTVAGGAVRAPRNVEALIGTPARYLVEQCGGLSGESARLVMGGPMMGLELASLDVPVIKGSSGILALDASELPSATPSPCIRCGQCVTACPMNLMPFEMSARIRTGALDEAVGMGLKDCLTCGACSYVCPAHIPLSHYFNYARGELTRRERNTLRQESIRKLVAERSERLERDAREKAEAAARRKAERERAKAEADAARAAKAAAKAAEESSA